MICGSKKYRRTAAIPYVPNAKLFDLETSNTSSFKEYFKFEALYVILNESDSREYYTNEHGLLFKLDNAASFTVEETTIRWFDGDPMGHLFIPNIDAPLNAVGYNWYGLKLSHFTQEYG